MAPALVHGAPLFQEARQGAWHFLLFGRRIRKETASVFPLLGSFCSRLSAFRSPPSLSFRRRGSRCEALPSPFERHAASRSARSPASAKSSPVNLSAVYRYCQRPPPAPRRLLPTTLTTSGSNVSNLSTRYATW